MSGKEPDSPFVQFVDGEVDSMLPVLYLFFAQSEADHSFQAEDLSPYEHNLQVLPVIKDVRDCGNYIPERIKSTNSLKLKVKRLHSQCSMLLTYRNFMFTHQLTLVVNYLRKSVWNFQKA